MLIQSLENQSVLPKLLWTEVQRVPSKGTLGSRAGLCLPLWGAQHP